MHNPVQNHYFERAAAFDRLERNQPVNENLQDTARKITFLALKIIVPLAAFLLTPFPLSIGLGLLSFILISKLENSCCVENNQQEIPVRNYRRIYREADLDDFQANFQVERDQNFEVRRRGPTSDSRHLTLKHPQGISRSPVYGNSQTLEMANSPTRHVAVGSRDFNSSDGLPRPYPYRSPQAVTLEERNSNSNLQHVPVGTGFVVQDNPVRNTSITTSARPVSYEAPPAIERSNVSLASRVDNAARSSIGNLFNTPATVSLEQRNISSMTQSVSDARNASIRLDRRDRSPSFDSTTPSGNVAVGGRSSRRNATAQPLATVEEKVDEEQRVAVGSRK